MKVFAIVALLLLCGVESAKKKTDKDIPISKEIPLIGCDVCEKVVSESISLVNVARSAKPKGKFEEIEIEDILDGICKSDSKHGAWLRKQDIIERKEGGKAYLGLIEPGGKRNI